jgi:glycosyltransferase 2 family protein
MLLQMNGTLPPRFAKGVVNVLAETSPLIQSIMRGVGRSKISFVISLVIVGIAVATLYHLLHGIEIGKVVDAIETQSGWKILIAAALVVAGYSNLVLYDVFALHTIGKRYLPWRVVAFASFTSYTIGHSLGAATFTCGLVRFRVYSFWNLTVVDIAKIAFMLGAAVTYDPGALGVFDHLPSSVNRLLGCSGLLAVGCYLLWLAPAPRTVGRTNWKIVLPDVRRTLLQIGIGSVDRLLASLSIFMLLPDSPSISFITLLVIFVVATLIGTISHTPGSLGVVEAAMLIGLPQFNREELLATLLTFRVLDFFLPLMLATILFGLRELRLVARRAHSRRAETAPTL